MEIHSFTDLNLQNPDPVHFQELRQAVPQQGVVLVKNQKLSLDQLVALTNRFGNPLLLPEGLRFNNTYAEYPEIARVSNVLPDGSLLKNHKAAEYWHSDGDFWQPGDNYLFNFLYAEVVPPTGGETGFSDLREAYKLLPHEIQSQIEDLSVLVRCDDIPDFKDSTEDEKQPDARHRIKHVHPETGQTGLYFGHTKALIEGVSDTKASQILSHLVRAIENPMTQYIHRWEPGDLLIWDNTGVMHRGMGGYHDHPRVLYRTQARIKPLLN